jgi:hypothetical protein
LKLFFPLYAAGHGSFSQMMLFLSVLKNATHFGAPKYPKRFVNPARWLLAAHAHQKNSSTLFNQFVFVFSLG